MTRLLFVPDGQTVIMLNSPLPAQVLAAAVNSGNWKPPAVYASLLTHPDTMGDKTERRTKSALRALLLDQVVIIAPANFFTSGENLSYQNSDKQHTGNTTTRTDPSSDGKNIPTLSPRQRQVLDGLVEGLTTKQIALQLGLSPRTVRMHVKALKNRFGANTCAESVGKAASLGLL